MTYCWGKQRWNILKMVDTAGVVRWWWRQSVLQQSEQFISTGTILSLTAVVAETCGPTFHDHEGFLREAWFPPMFPRRAAGLIGYCTLYCSVGNDNQRWVDRHMRENNLWENKERGSLFWNCSHRTPRPNSRILSLHDKVPDPIAFAVFGVLSRFLLSLGGNQIGCKWALVLTGILGGAVMECSYCSSSWQWLWMFTPWYLALVCCIPSFYPLHIMWCGRSAELWCNSLAVLSCIYQLHFVFLLFNMSCVQLY